MKKIFTYMILLAVTYFLVGFFTYFITKPYYRNFNNYEILTENPKIEVTECKSSYTKGYIKGTVTVKVYIDDVLKKTVDVNLNKTSSLTIE